MKGVLLCKFDEERGYVPVKVVPSQVRKRKNMELFKEIARNAIGFGTQVDFQGFSLSGVHCLAKRFSISDAEARGGSILYALVMFSGDSDEFDKSLLGDSTEQLISDWGARSNIMKSLYDSISREEETSGIPFSEPTPQPTSAPTRPLLPKELFIEKEGFFADGSTLSRNLLMLLSFFAMFWVLYLNYEIFSFGFMLVIGVFIFVIVAKKDRTLKLTSGFLFFFFILLFIRLSIELIGDPSSIAFLGGFPDFQRPELALISIFSGILVCLGLDRGHAADKRSFVVGICGIIFLVIFFLTPIFHIMWSYIVGS